MLPALRIATLTVAMALLGLSAEAFSRSPAMFRRTTRPVVVRPESSLYFQVDGEGSDIPQLSIPQRPISSTSSISAIGEEARRAWVDKSLQYYSKVMREERRRNLGQIKEYDEYNYDFLQLAKKHYFALRKIKDGKYQHAELIYRRIIDEILQEGEEDGGSCDHAKLAVTTLLLALHLQRTGDAKQTRSVFLSFFRIVIAEAAKEPHHKCACSAKVLQAFALFEMKQGNEQKSLEIVLKAIRLDPSLRPVLKWKQFRSVVARRKRLQQQRRQLLRASTIPYKG